jgi:hypothetical protein
LGQTITNSTNRIFGFPSKELFNRLQKMDTAFPVPDALPLVMKV